MGYYSVSSPNEDITEIEKATLAYEPTIGSTDVSRCLPGWIRTFCKLVERKEGYSMSADAVRALAHTLLAAKYRVNRLIKERDTYKEMYESIRNQTVPTSGAHVQLHSQHSSTESSTGC